MQEYEFLKFRKRSGNGTDELNPEEKSQQEEIELNNAFASLKEIGI